MAGTEFVPWQQLTILLSVAVASHFIIRRFRQPTSIGEILIGILLGPSALGFVIGFDQSLIGLLASLGAIVLLFLIGLECDLRAIYTRKNISIAAGGVLLPWVAGYIVADIFLPSATTTFAEKVFVGTTLVATSVAITASILLELKLMGSDIATTILGAAVVDDVLGLIVLGITVGISRGTVDIGGILYVLVAAVAFLVIGGMIIGRFLSRLVEVVDTYGRKFGLKHSGFVVALGIAFFYAFAAQTLGLHAIVGAFVAGTLFSGISGKEDFTEGAEYLGSIFTPIFFISLGIGVYLWGIDAQLVVFGVILTVVAIASKVFGCGIPARRVGMSRTEARAVGYGMAPRGEVGLAIAAVGATPIAPGMEPVIPQEIYSVLVVVIVLTTLLPPPVIRRYLSHAISKSEDKGA